MGGFRFQLLLLVVLFSIFSSAPYLSRSHAETLHGTPQDDTIISAGTYDGIISYEGDDTILIESSSRIIGESQQTAESTAEADVVAIDAGSGDDRVTNNGQIVANAAADALPVDGAASQATANATGIIAGDGADVIQNSATIAATAASNSESGGISINLEGNTEFESLTTSTAIATGIEAGRGKNQIRNTGVIDTIATSASNASSINLSVGDSGGTDVRTTANAIAAGISGGEDGDTIDNRGDLGLSADADATGVSVALDVAGTMKGDAAGTSVGDSSTTATAAATGIDAGAGDDEVINDGVATTTNANASATGVSVGLTVSGSLEGKADGKALSDASVTANAAATGVDGGSGQDTIDNWSKLSSEVDASATGVAASLKVGFTKEGDVSPDALADGAALSDTSVTANAAATGIDGGEDGDTIDNRGDIELLSNSGATGVSVALDVAGTMKGDAAGSSASDASVTAASTTIGIEGGEGDDTIDNEGMITLMNGSGDDETDARATAVSVGLTVSGSMEGNVEGKALSDASALADAVAIGIKGDGGKDTIKNRGAIVANVDASATAVGVGVDVSLIIAKDENAEGSVSGAALSDATVTANATASGIDSGGDADAIENRGDMALLAKSDATGVAVSLDVAGSVALKGDVEGEIEGKSLSNASTEAYAETTGIDGGDDSDQITNTGNFNVLRAESNSTGVSASLNISAGLAANGDAKVNVTGEAVSDARVTAEAATAAIKGGSGGDDIINEGDFVDVGSDSEAVSVAASLDITGALAFKGDADASTTGSAVSSASANALATTVAIEGGVGNDIISNTGNIINLESDSTATSVSAGANVSAVVTIKGNAEADVTGEAVGDSRVISQAIALGFDGGLGDDEIDNEGDISLLSTADATGVAAELNVSAALSFKGVSTADVSGTAASDSSVFAKAEATGIDGGWGQDRILNSGNITLMNGDEDIFDADALGVSASLNVSGNVAIKGVAAGSVEGAAASNATVTAEAAATGIDGGGDNDIIGNTGAIKLLPSSNADGIAASLNVSGNMVGDTEGSASSDASVTAMSTATGIDGGEGDDTIDNEGMITLMKQEASEEVDAKALGVAASLDISGNLNGTAEGESISKATTTAETTATGIGGGRGQDTITNTAAILADVDSDAEGVAVAADVTVTVNGQAEGSSLSDVSSKAIATAFGIDGGEDNDVIDNEAHIQLFTDSAATSTAVSVAVEGSLRGTAEGEALSKATTTADAFATGIEGGSGRDEINNRSTISADVKSDANATAVSADVTFTDSGSAEGAALSDVSALSFALASGIDGGQGDDMLKNEGDLLLRSESESDATAVSVSLTVAMKGVAKGMAMADSSSLAIAESAGIRGEDGADDIDNGANLTDGMVDPSLQKIAADSQSTATANSVTVSGTASIGLSDGASVADSSATSEAISTGIDGGLGNDTIDNIMEIEATSQADATAKSTSVTVGISVGASGSASLGDASATARANATGIKGGADDDEIINIASITAGVANDNLDPMATAQASSTSVDVGIAVGYTTREVSANSSAFAEANAAGISGGSGDDWIYNTGDITVGPDPEGTGGMANASGTSTAVLVEVAVGASLGKTSSDTSSTAVANIAGISGGSGNDEVYNSGTITAGTDPDETAAMAIANAASESVAVNIAIGASFSDASSNASATAQSNATGIETDAGSDLIDNTGVINAFSSSEAVGIGKTTKVSLTLGVSEGGAESDASALATSFATGIDSGGDTDEITTSKAMVVKAGSTSRAISTASDYNILSLGEALQSASANSSSTAETIARGIDGGAGGDIIMAEGSFEVAANSFVTGTARSSTVTGVGGGFNVQEAQAKTETVSNSLAIGIDGGEGNDNIQSTATMSLNAYSSANTQARSKTDTGFNIAGASSGESVAGAAANVIANAIGIRGGESELGLNETDEDTIVSGGPITVTANTSATTNSTATANSITLFGSASGKAASDASATVRAEATGIESGADKDIITSKSTLTVTAEANGSVTSISNVKSDVIFGDASSRGASDASAEVAAEATGIDGGNGDDIITNELLGLVTVDATSTGSVSAQSNVEADVTFGSASSKAVSDASVTKLMKATGIVGGDGMDNITNYGTLMATATSEGDVSSGSHSNSDATFGSTRSAAFADAGAEGSAYTAGITGGGDDDIIRNMGRLDSIAKSTLTVKTSSVSISDSTFGDAYAAAFTESSAQGKAEATAISGDSGNDVIENGGVVNAKSTADTDVQSATVALADSTFGDADTLAGSSNYAAGESTAEGITAGAGNDDILNTELITVEASSTVKNKSNVYSSNGPASSDARTMALAIASGINSGADDDTVTNSSTVFVKAAPRVISANRTFGSGGVNGKVGIELNADAQGITGGEGNDGITNEGEILVFIGGPETESTVSEEATSGATAVTDNSLIGEDPEAMVGKWIRIPGKDNPDFFTQIMDFDQGSGQLTLRDTLTFDLPPDATYTLYDYGEKKADITLVTVNVGGGTKVDVSTTASIDATGIEGGDGDDEIVNSGSVAVSASNLINTVSFTIAGSVDADTDIESTVHATGIAGDGKDDTSIVTEDSTGGTVTFVDTKRIGEDPDAIIGKRIRFKTGESADFFTVVDEFEPETGTFTLADRIPEGGLSKDDIYALGGGSNGVTNAGLIDVAANSIIDAASWSLTFGNADIEASGRANAVSAGVRGGEYDDFVENVGRIDTQSSTEVLSTQRATAFFGGAEQELVFEAVSNSAGMSTGAGDDIIFNGNDERAEQPVVDVDAIAMAHVNGVTTTFSLFGGAQETHNLVDARSVSTAMGLDLGEGQNLTRNGGQINVSAVSTTEAEAISDFGSYDETNARANATATASASGINAEDGGDTVQSNGGITVNATALADSVAQGSDVIGGSANDFASAVTDDSSSGSITFTDSSLIATDPNDIVGQYVRFLTGNNEDFTAQVIGFAPQTGTIILGAPLPGDLKAVELDDEGNIVTPADEYTLANGRDGESGAFANAFATGINLNNGFDNGVTTVEIEGNLHVQSYAEANSTARAFYNGNADAGATATAEARGIVTGGGDDVIRNEGTITVEASAVTIASGSDVTETATATGIDAGDGNNNITNEGEINVTSSVAQPSGDANASGIITGAGDDTITNGGKIITSEITNGTKEPGIGMATGGGSDHVTLAQGTLIKGSIKLGEGNDTLVFTGSPVASGEVTGEGGIDALMFKGAGTSDSIFSDFESVTKRDPGTFTVENFTTVKRVEVDEGILEMNTNYQLAEGGTFQAKIYGSGDTGQLKIKGEADLAGTLKVVKGPGAYVNGSKYDVLVADTTTDWFSDEIMPEPTTLVSFRANGYPDRVEVEPLVKSFTTVAKNRVHTTIGQYLDRILSVASGDLSHVLGEFQNLSGSQFKTAFSSLSPDSYNNSTSTSLNGTQQYVKTIQQRVHSLRASLKFAAADTRPGYGVWLQGFGQRGDQDSDDGFTGYDFDLYGGTIGADRFLNDHVLLGISLGASKADIDFDDNMGDSDVDAFIGSLYGSWFTKNYYLDASLSYGYQEYDNNRNITIGAIHRNADSDHDGSIFSGYLEGGYNFSFGRWMLGPYATMNYLYLDEDGFTESGAGSLNLSVDDRETDALLSQLGAVVAGRLSYDNFELMPELRLAWKHDFDIDDQVVTSAFAGAPGVKFSIDGQDLEQNSLVVEVGATLFYKNGLSVPIKYAAELRDDYTAHGVLGLIRYEF
jgi:uncharacterized protein YhjY with autotransporter beta-barrel domain